MVQVGKPAPEFEKFDLNKFSETKKALLNDIKTILVKEYNEDQEEVEDLFDDVLFKHVSLIDLVGKQLSQVLAKKDATELGAFWAIMEDMFTEANVSQDDEEVKKTVLDFYQIIKDITTYSYIPPEGTTYSYIPEGVLTKLLDASTNMEKQIHYNPDWINHNFINAAAGLGVVEEYNSSSMKILSMYSPSEDDVLGSDLLSCPAEEDDSTVLGDTSFGSDD